MKKVLILCCLLLFVSSSIAQDESSESSLGIGVNAGILYPLVQDDQGSGTAIGVKAIFQIIGSITAETNISFMKYGDPTYDDDPDLFEGYEGSDLRSYGVDGVLGGSYGKTGIHPYFLLGFGFFNIQREVASLETSQNETDFGYTAGLGLEIGMSRNMSIDARSKLIVIPTDGGGSKKSASLTAGINIYIGR